MATRSLFLAGAAVMFAAPAMATTLDFTSLAAGAVSPTTYASDGVTIFLQNYGAPLVADAQAQVGVIAGLSNSLYGTSGSTSRPNYPYYPTYQYMTFLFSSGVSDVSFTFDNEGVNSASSYTAYDGFGHVIATGALSSIQDALVSVSGSGIRSLIISNGENGARDWVYGVSNLSFDVAAIPEASTWAMLIAGFAALGFAGYGSRRTAPSIV